MSRRESIDYSAAEWARFMADVARIVGEVRDGYVRLYGMTTPERASIGDGLSRSGGVSAGVPVALDVLDLIAAVDAVVDELVPLARGAMRLGPRPPRPGRPRIVRTVSGLRFLRDGIRHVWEADPGTGEVIVDRLEEVRARVAGRTREGVPTYRSVRPCEGCGSVSVVVYPARGVSRCVSCGQAQAAARDGSECRSGLK